MLLSFNLLLTSSDAADLSRQYDQHRPYLYLAEGAQMAKTRTRDLALDALAEIQAMEAAGEVAAFRARWLDGHPLPDWSEAMRWLSESTGSGSPRTLDFRFEVNRISIPLDIVGDAEKARAWWAQWLASNLDRLASFPLSPGWRNPLFHLKDELGNAVEALSYGPESGLEGFVIVRTGLVERYHWTERQAERFILLGELPVLRAVHAEYLTSIRMGDGVTPGSGPYSTEITLRCRPQATQQDVADAYEAVRSCALHNEFGLAVKARIRATTSERSRDLAVLGARIAANGFVSWEAARSVYLESHEKESLIYGPEKGEDAMGRFRRDTRAAFRQVTGLDLHFRPTKGVTNRSEAAGRAGSAGTSTQDGDSHP